MAQQVTFWKTPNDYIVVIGYECYEMDAHADEPNGVCIYLGEADANAHPQHSTLRQLGASDCLPIGLVRQTVKLSRSLAAEEIRRCIYQGMVSLRSHALAGGRSLAEVRDAAGHANIGTTSIYLLERLADLASREAYAD